MRKLSFRLKQNLARMRVEQRIQQRLDEKNDEIRGVAAGRTNYCHTCKLNYRQERTRHNESEMHKVYFCNVYTIFLLHYIFISGLVPIFWKILSLWRQDNLYPCSSVICCFVFFLLENPFLFESCALYILINWNWGPKLEKNTCSFCLMKFLL